MYKIIILMAFSLLSFFSCGSSSKTFVSMPVDEFAKLIEKDEVQLVDVRTKTEFEQSHIPGAINIDVMGEGFEQKADEVLNKTKKVALYCRSGGRSKKAANILYEKGYKVYELNKGFISWETSGNKIIEQ